MDLAARVARVVREASAGWTGADGTRRVRHARSRVTRCAIMVKASGERKRVEHEALTAQEPAELPGPASLIWV